LWAKDLFFKVSASEKAEFLATISEVSESKLCLQYLTGWSGGGWV